MSDDTPNKLIPKNQELPEPVDHEAIYQLLMAGVSAFNEAQKTELAKIKASEQDRVYTYEERIKQLELARHQFDRFHESVKTSVWLNFSLRFGGMVVLSAACYFFREQTALAVSLLSSIVYLAIGWPSQRQQPPRPPE